MPRFMPKRRGVAQRKKLTDSERKQLTKEQMLEFWEKSKTVPAPLIDKGVAWVHPWSGKLGITPFGREEVVSMGKRMGVLPPAREKYLRAELPEKRYSRRIIALSELAGYKTENAKKIIGELLSGKLPGFADYDSREALMQIVIEKQGKRAIGLIEEELTNSLHGMTSEQRTFYKQFLSKELERLKKE